MCNYSFSLHVYARTRTEKHFWHGVMPFWHLIGICWVNLKTFQHAAIVSSSTGSRVLYGPWKVMRVFPVPNTRLSLVRHTSALKWFLGVHKWTGSPSRSNSISSQGINCLCHWKLFREITLACVHAAQASLLLDGLQNVLKMVCRGFSKKVLPQLMGLQMKIFLFFQYQMSIGQTHHLQTLSQTYCSFFGRPPC